MNRTILIDGDILAYQAATSVERTVEFDEDVAVTASKDEGIEDLEGRIDRLKEKLFADKVVIALSDPAANFRKAILPTYKANRAGTRKPILLSFLRSHLVLSHDAKIKEALEGDDVLGIIATNPVLFKGSQKVIVSIDKDMRTIPGWHYNPDKDVAPVAVSEEEADHWHMMQTLTGDPTDGYAGCPGTGPVKAAKVLDAAPTDAPEGVWDRVVKAFEKAGLTAADALVQAQVARICRNSDYDHTNKRPIPWRPTLG